MPERIQRKRTKGWRMPEGAVYVGRPAEWSNPYRIGDPGIPDAETAVRLFKRNFDEGLWWAGFVVEALAGRDLACWCPLNQPCHADVLLDLANPKETTRA